FLRENVTPLEGELTRENLSKVGLPPIFSRAWLTLGLAEIGEFKEGAAWGEEALLIPEVLEHPYSLSIACCYVGHLHLRQGNVNNAIPVLERGYAACQRWHIEIIRPWTASYLGYAYALAGRIAEGIPLLEQGSTSSTWSHWSWLPLWLSEAY